MAHQSDLVQRISRRRAHKTWIEKRFKGWHHMLLNAIVNFAIERGLKRIFSPTSTFAMRHTDRKRTVKPELFERIYDRDVLAAFPAEKASERWWAVDVEAARPRTLLGARGIEPVRVPERTVCLCHDVERGLGHVATDPAFAALADRTAQGHLEEMLAAEAAAGVRATYNVVGVLFDELRAPIERHGHCLAFHSYDHALDEIGDGAAQQLERCRRVDYRIKGYRVPRSKPTAELTERNLCLRNFEWIASSGAWRHLPGPVMSSRLVTVPIWSDDFPLHTGQMRYPDWERAVLERVEQSRFTAFSMHDCYAAHWLPHYGDFLRRIRDLAELRTVDEVASDVILQSGI